LQALKTKGDLLLKLILFRASPCVAFSALTLLIQLVGHQEEHPTCKNSLMRCWCGHLFEARCKWFACGPADATATPSSLASLTSKLV